ncbi:MAG TPA: alkaline phosphatase, partial [Planctomycetota bacterium]|nr:alkaline phosphatase [Planctomycetota bacterium]
ADHSHVFNLAGYPIRPKAQLPYVPTTSPTGWLTAPHDGLLNVVYDVNPNTGVVAKSLDKNGVPYTLLVYGNGPGYRGAPRVDPASDPFPGLFGQPPAGPSDPDYLQESAVPIASETHAGEEVALYAIGAGSRGLRGTVKNTFCFELMRNALGL